MSGIKKVDFVYDNLSPSLSMSTGIWISREIGVSLSYKGHYFYTIADNARHNYSYFFLQTLINVSEYFRELHVLRSEFDLIPHFGYGIFYNAHYEGFQVNGNIGFILSHELGKSSQIYIDLSSVVGWDIYQGNEDILPSAAIGLIIDVNK